MSNYPSKVERRIVALKQWAMRAADELNGVHPSEVRAKHLGTPCDYGNQFMGHWCKCGEPPITWAQVYADAQAIMGREGIS